MGAAFTVGEALSSAREHLAVAEDSYKRAVEVQAAAQSDIDHAVGMKADWFRRVRALEDVARLLDDGIIGPSPGWDPRPAEPPHGRFVEEKGAGYSGLRYEKHRDGVSLHAATHPAGPAVDEDRDVNPASLETVEVDLPVDLLALALEDIERRWTSLRGPAMAYFETTRGDRVTYLTVCSQGVKWQGEEAVGYPTEGEAVMRWHGNVMMEGVLSPGKLYWRFKPELRRYSDGGFFVYSRLAFSTGEPRAEDMGTPHPRAA